MGRPLKLLVEWLDNHASEERYLFTLRDLRGLFPDLSESAFKTLISRAVQGGHLFRLCRGLYGYKRAVPPGGLVLFHAAAILRADHFNYISLETALSDEGVISQMPMNWITVVSSGRSSEISCGHYGTIEFVHTRQRPDEVMDRLVYDAECRMWRASVSQAIRDMKMARRNLDLVDWGRVDELI